MMKFNCIRVPGPVSLLTAVAALSELVSAQTPGPRIVLGVSATQAVLSYRALNPSACQVQVSTDKSMIPLATDVDPSLFNGADQDNREGSVSSPSGLSRYFVVGKRRADLALDGKRYSRALQAFTRYFFVVTCGSTSESGQFTTANPPIGNNFPEPPPFDAQAFGNYAWPTIDWNDTSKPYIDPLTGILLRRVTAPGWYGASQTGKQFGPALDLHGTWTNLANITSGSAFSLAGYSGNGDDPVFVAFDPAQLTGFGGTTLGSWYPGQTLDNVMVRIFGTGNSTISGCLSDDSGAHCVSPVVDFVTLKSSGGNPAGTFPTACATDTSTGCFPNNGFWGGWNFKPVNRQMTASSGTVNVAGSTVTPGWPPAFDLNWKPGGKIFITGSAPGCVSNLCTIAAVNSSSSLTIQENAGTLSATGYKTANSGVLLWVKKTSGTNTASISVNLDYAYSDQFGMPANGTVAQCSPNPITVSWAADGLTPISPVAGQLCLAGHQYGPTQVLYLLIPSTGETRLLTPFWFMNSSDPIADQPADPVNIHVLNAAFDTSDPNTIYGQVATNGGVALFKGVYNAATYRYKAYAHSLYPSANANYNPGQDTTKYWYRGPGWADSGFTWTNLTKASQGQDLSSQIARVDSNWDARLFQLPSITQISKGRAFTVNSPAGNTSSESISLIHSFDLKTGRLIQSADTWRTFPNRWCAMHSNVALEGWYGLICNPLGGAFGFGGNAAVMGIGPWQMTPTAVLKNGAFSADTSMTAAAPLDACPAIPSSLQGLAPANPKCVTFQSPMACSHTPFPGENSKWPCESNPTYSELQAIAPGDGLMVVNGTGNPEFLLIISVFSLGSSSYQFTAIRGAAGPGYRNAPANWTGYAMPPSASCAFPGCTPGVGMWFDGRDTSVSWRLDPGAFAGHSDLGNSPTPGGNSYCQPLNCRYDTPMTQQIGSFAKATSFQTAKFAGIPGEIAYQGYPSVHQLTAPPSEQRWMLDFRHINPSFGAGAEVISDVGAVTYNLVAGTKGVFRFTSVNGGLNYKSAPVVAYAGYHLLQDISSPATGNLITDATPWKYCVALKAGECHAGSAPGEVYMSVPQTFVRGDQNCVSNWYEDNFPCVYTASAQVAWGIQQDISSNDPAGANWRRITMGFSGPGRQFQFGTFIPDPTGAWAFMQGYWLDGVRNDLLMAKLPPWPNPSDVTTNRSNFVAQSITAAANIAQPEARVRFGYAENGSAGSFFCTPRQEACTTGGSPYTFLSEVQHWQSCHDGCRISIPAVPGRVLYYAIDRRDGNGNVVLGERQVQLVP